MVVGIAPLLGACSFSAYEEDFSCKNQDHGGCAHPMQAYENAVAEGPQVHVQEAEGEVSASTPHHNHALKEDAYSGYQNSVYEELSELVQEPDTPIMAAPKTVRTLILPYADPKKPDRLYMPRYVYSILEAPRFVLGGYLKPRVQGRGLMDLMNQLPPEAANEKE